MVCSQTPLAYTIVFSFQGFVKESMTSALVYLVMLLLAVCIQMNMMVTAMEGAPAPEPEPEPECLEIIDVLSSMPELSFFVAAVGAARLDVRSFNGQKLGEDSTVFVPTNDAWIEFMELYPTSYDDPSAIVANGNASEITQRLLTQIMWYHVVRENIFYLGDFTDGQRMTMTFRDYTNTVRILTNTVSVTTDTVVIEGIGTDTTVITPDIPACDSVVHVVDTVLLPFRKPTP